jgi:hypothetical protein
MREYWRELEAAWGLDLDIEEGDCALGVPDSPGEAASSPPADWGDPWQAGAERLAARRGRCEDLFDHLRRAEACLAEAKESARESGAAAGAVLGEADEYSIADALVELDCARLSAYHELAAGDERAAADIANLALSASAALRGALARIADPRERREARLVACLFYELRLRKIRRLNARSAARRLVDLWYTKAKIAASEKRASRAYDPRGKAAANSAGRSLAPPPRER